MHHFSQREGGQVRARARSLQLPRYLQIIHVTWQSKLFVIFKSLARSTIASSVTDNFFAQPPLEETTARGSKEFPCRAFRPLFFPRDGYEPYEGALGSQDFPPKRTVTKWGGVDVMGPWLRLRSEDVVLLSHRTIHMNPAYSLITRSTFRLDLCYCVDKLHRCFHYEVDKILSTC